jgi:hypothetical protein
MRPPPDPSMAMTVRRPARESHQLTGWTARREIQAGVAVAVFEPVHGSAPDIAGRGIANAIGAIWSGAVMLDHLGHAAAADEVMDAVTAVLRNSDARTLELGGTSTTAALTEESVQVLDTRPTRLPTGRNHARKVDIGLLAG